MLLGGNQPLYWRVSKYNNVLNRLFAFILIILLSPIFLFVAIAIIIEDGFLVFFTQKRVGVNYSYFWGYKFRSMKKNTPYVATPLPFNTEQYLLTIGNFIRKTNLEELPKLIDIIEGKMLFVGPKSLHDPWLM